MDKNSILLYTSDYEPVKDFSLEEKGLLFDAIFEYASTGNTNELPPVVLLAFKFFRMHIDENNKKWNDIKTKRKDAGRKGGEAKAKQNVANVAVNVNDNVNVSTEVDKESRKKDSPKASLSDRNQKFKDELTSFVEQYGKEMIRAFFDYWSEPNKTNTKMRFELEKTWNLSGRLRTWERRSNEKR
ncbi:MAG: DUF6291 domain-containing protein [Bacteroides sp.]|uniref:DUF6291 domain-containing protein n=1 Tax=Bacteroides sp. TaxID=29523 RepID=UPI002FC7A6CF